MYLFPEMLWHSDKEAARAIEKIDEFDPRLKLTGSLDWVDVLREQGYDPDKIEQVMFRVLTDQEYPPIAEFIRQSKYWRTLSKPVFLEFIWGQTRNEPNAILDMFEVFATELNAQTAYELAMEASRHIHGVWSTEQAEAILQLDLKTQMRVCTGIVMGRQSHGAKPISNVHEARIFVQVAMHDHQIGSDRGRADAWYAIKWTLEWVPTEYVPSRSLGEGTRRPTRDDDPERPVRMYRWFMQIARGVPMRDWSGTQVGAEETRRWHQQDIVRLDSALREILTELGFRFAKVESMNEQGVTRLAAILRPGDWVYRFFHQDGDRKEVICEGDEVILARHHTGELTVREKSQHFADRSLELHPVADPTEAMREAIAGRSRF